MNQPEKAEVAVGYTGTVLSADSHVVEPRDLWLKRMDNKWRDKAPRIEALDESGDYIVIDGMRPRPLAFQGAMADMKLKGMEITGPKGYRYEEHMRPGFADPVERLKDQDIDGVSGEVIYPGIAHYSGDAPDADYVYAIARTYNDWLSEFCSTSPRRLRGVALLPAKGPIESFITEAQRVARMPGICAVMMPVPALESRPYNSPEWDPLWAVLQDLNIACSLHVGSSPSIAFKRAHGPGASGIVVCTIKFEVYNEVVQQLVWGGAPMRFPKLTWGLVEGAIGWIPSALTLMDHWWNDHKGWMKPKLEEPPSFYFHRNFFATFEEDRAGVMTREMIGVSNILWGSDYPHSEGVWPYSRKQIDHDFAGVPAEETRKVVHDNAVRLFGFPGR